MLHVINRKEMRDICITLGEKALAKLTVHFIV
ncbi:hypothetical protein JOC94_004537 [Bacillus thermophilus]|uniref:Uncharacterized protein n=1 Tax=Siminovitchia thermophila TaxID=1245522 RepID=A0ABS2RF59_9BACI|nr:hypothetical protein [Siminovitchia thermophila]